MAQVKSDMDWTDWDGVSCWNHGSRVLLDEGALMSFRWSPPLPWNIHGVWFYKITCLKNCRSSVWRNRTDEEVDETAEAFQSHIRAAKVNFRALLRWAGLTTVNVPLPLQDSFGTMTSSHGDAFLDGCRSSSSHIRPASWLPRKVPGF